MSFTWGKTTITARPVTIRDDEAIARLQRKLPEDALMMTLTPFTEFMVSASVEGEPPVPLVGEASPEADIQASYAAWQALPRRFKRQWQEELDKAEGVSPNAST